MQELERGRRAMANQEVAWGGRQGGTARLGRYRPAVEAALEKMERERIVARIWEQDHTVWKPEPDEIANRLGWLHTAEAMHEQVPRLEAWAQAVRQAGYTGLLLLGMGGSSLAPELFGKVFARQGAGLSLAVLDTTDPDAVLAHAARFDPARTLFIVSTKSGGTVETLSLFNYFYNRTAAVLGADRAGRQFVAITDPGSSLADLARSYGFRDLFLNDPNIGGRYSALSCFGLVPAALVGVDLARLLERARAMACACGPDGPVHDNPAAWLGAILGELALAGCDKVTLFMPSAIASLGDWVEQLLAESTGKEGKGILPVVGEPPGPAERYGHDRLFIQFEMGDAVQPPMSNTHPVVHLPLEDVYDLGGQFFLWELATAVAGQRLGINPFDQPDVEAAKVLARKAVLAYRETGTLPHDEPAPLTAEALNSFLAQARPGDYVALHAYLQPTAETDAALQRLRLRLRDRLKLATTVGYGPRFLHSTGQLHKGDRGNGLFLQFTSDPVQDLPIPDKAGSPAWSITFGVLKMAQAVGDRQALLAAGRRVIRFHLGSDPVSGLRQLAEALA